MERLKKAAPILIVITFVLGIWLFYSYQAASKDPSYYEPAALTKNMSATECLARSHEVSAEAMLAREKAMLSFAQSVNDWLIRKGVWLLECF